MGEDAHETLTERGLEPQFGLRFDEARVEARRPRQSSNKASKRRTFLRKSFLVAGVAALAVGTSGVAYAQNAEPKIDVTTSVSPSKAGTKSKPKNTTFKLKVTNDPASKTSAQTIKITLPSTLKLSTKGLPQCTASNEEIVSSAGAVCKASKAGKGSAHAVLLSNNTNVSFEVTPFIGKNELLFYLAASIGNKYVVHGKIKGSTMTIAITPDLQQPVAGLYAALIDLDTTLNFKKGKNFLFSSVGCKSKKQTVKVSVVYVANPTPPSKPSADGSGDGKCS